MKPGAILRHSRLDAWLVYLAIAHGLLLYIAPSIPLIGLGLWWNTNTIGHNFIHLPFFRAPWLNHLFAGYLTLVTGVPQRLWRERHLAHHREEPWKLRWSEELAVQAFLVSLAWVILIAIAPRFFLLVYVPGYALGLALCFLQGHYEHARGTQSYYGGLYNRLFFNDGFHVEHHARPGRHWAELTPGINGISHSSRWPAVLRWMDDHPLHALERIVLRSTSLQALVLRCHERAWLRLVRDLPPLACITIIGGGLFPRSALILKKLLPETELTIVDAIPEHIESARQRLNGAVKYKLAFYDARSSAGLVEASDMVVFPLSFKGKRDDFYTLPSRFVVVHDWMWRRRGKSTVVSWLLLKRLNLISH